ncbi:hypothetical protein [Nonomuraea fuscirosea]|uniref:hypothetical protein n=1 Tax=Nonomuraea fuscirosea TaxID=1291556 RepID=UPI0015E79358|nr:hypothetical protein [Nonomuraea fuscirosea]
MKEELMTVLGDADAVLEPLTHNPDNAVTRGIWRARAGCRRGLKTSRHRPVT